MNKQKKIIQEFKKQTPSHSKNLVNTRLPILKMAEFSEDI